MKAGLLWVQDHLWLHSRFVVSQSKRDLIQKWYWNYHKLTVDLCFGVHAPLSVVAKSWKQPHLKQKDAVYSYSRIPSCSSDACWQCLSFLMLPEWEVVVDCFEDWINNKYSKGILINLDSSALLFKIITCLWHWTCQLAFFPEMQFPSESHKWIVIHF